MLCMVTCSLTALERGRRGRCHREWQGKGKRGEEQAKKTKDQAKSRAKNQSKRLNNQTLTEICEIGASSSS
jgi:hypothetical protein